MHCHLYDEAFDADRGETLQRALDAGVGLMLLPDIDSTSSDSLDELYHTHPHHFRRMAGLHPTSVKADFEAELAHVRHRLDAGGFVAVGEIGMDLYWDRTYETEQREALKYAFQSAAQFESFFAGLMVAMKNTIAVKAEAYALMTLICSENAIVTPKLLSTNFTFFANEYLQALVIQFFNA